MSRYQQEVRLPKVYEGCIIGGVVESNGGPRGHVTDDDD